MSKNKNEDIYCVFCSNRELVRDGFASEVVVKCDDKCEKKQDECGQKSLF
jgi:hypothetical protein